MQALELPRKPEMTMPGPAVRRAYVPVAGPPGRPADRTPMRRRRRHQCQLSRPSVLRASLPFRAWPAYPCRPPAHFVWKRYRANF